MGEIVIIPVHGREDVVEQCLKALRSCEPTITIRLFADRGYASNTLAGLQMTYDAPGFTLAHHNAPGNATCVREAMLWASEQPYDLVHYIESDVIVTPEYFTWSREKHNDDGLFASCAWRNPTGLEQEMTLNYFSGIGCCLKRENCRTIANNIRPPGEWDTQVAKMMLRDKRRCAFAATRLVSHIGWEGISFKGKGAGDTGHVAWQNIKLGDTRTITQRDDQWVMVR